VIAILGSQWGDEGKGKLVDSLSASATVCARFNGGANAGHTLFVDGNRFAMHLIPCGILHSQTMNILCSGTVIHLKKLLEEVNTLSPFIPDALNRIFISSRAHILFDFHQKLDSANKVSGEGSGVQIGTTRRGIGPCYASKISRTGARMAELLHWESFERTYRRLVTEVVKSVPWSETDIQEELDRHRSYAKILKDRIVDSVEFIHLYLNDKEGGNNLLIEGANGAMLDIDFGTYPFVTSSSTTVGGICTGMGIPPRTVEFVVGVAKAYLTRVGNGPFPTEVFDAVGQHLLSKGKEYGTTTGRPRRCGWLDVAMLQYSNIVNGFNALNITKLDVLSGLKELKIAVKYRNRDTGADLPPSRWPSIPEEYDSIEPVYETLPGWDDDITAVTRFEALPENARMFIMRLQKLLKIPIYWIGVGPDRNNTVTLPSYLVTTEDSRAKTSP